MRNGVRVEEDSNHTTSQIIVDTSGNTVYNNTLRVRGRVTEQWNFQCIVGNNRPDFSLVGAEVTASITVRSKLCYIVVIRNNKYLLF